MVSVLVVGAGPVGLTAALELARRGIEVRIVERKEKRERFGKAIAIHPRTLELFQSSGVTDRWIAAGYKATTLHLCDRGKPCLTLHVDRLHHPYPFIVLLEQYRTEEILEAALAERGVTVEWGCEMVDFSQDESKVTAELTSGTAVRPQKVLAGDFLGEGSQVGWTATSPGSKPLSEERNGRDGRRSRKAPPRLFEGVRTASFDYLIGADGAHSWVRKRLELKFSGKSYQNDWNFIDAKMSWHGQSHEVWLNALPEGHVGVILPIAPGLYRIATNGEDASIAIPPESEVHEIVWNSTFRIQIRQVESYQQGRVFLAGDAAHIHSPAGGRGMNLGMEDAIFLAEKIALAQTDSYTADRHPIGRKIIRYTEFLVRLNTLRNPLLKWARNRLLYPLLRLPPLQQVVLRQVTGVGGFPPAPYPE